MADGYLRTGIIGKNSIGGGSARILSRSKISRHTILFPNLCCMSSPADRLRKLLREFAEHEKPNEASFTREFRRALLDHGSETPDNLDAAQKIDVGSLEEGRPCHLRGFRIARTGDSVTSILNHIEGTTMPADLQDAFPKLTQEDYDAAIRVAVLCLTAFESNTSPKIA